MAKILVVEDNADEAQMVKMILEAEGYEVDAAANGQEGLEKAEADKPDLIVLDVMMPILDGFAMCANPSFCVEMRDFACISGCPVPRVLRRRWPGPRIVWGLLFLLVSV